MGTNKDKTVQIQDNDRTQYRHPKQIGFLFPFSTESTREVLSNHPISVPVRFIFRNMMCLLNPR